MAENVIKRAFVSKKSAKSIRKQRMYRNGVKTLKFNTPERFFEFDSV